MNIRADMASNGQVIVSLWFDETPERRFDFCAPVENVEGIADYLKRACAHVRAKLETGSVLQ